MSCHRSLSRMKKAVSGPQVLWPEEGTARLDWAAPALCVPNPGTVLRVHNRTCYPLQADVGSRLALSVMRRSTDSGQATVENEPACPYVAPKVPREAPPSSPEGAVS